MFVFAQPAVAGPNSRETTQISQLQQPQLMLGAQSAQAQVQIERRRIPQFELPDAGSYEQSGTEGGSAEGARKSGRLTAEERRALRRQINDAGNDLYNPDR